MSRLIAFWFAKRFDIKNKKIVPIALEGEIGIR